MTLEGVLFQAKQYAINRGKATEFTFNEVRFTIVFNSNLGLAYCAFFSARTGDIVGPCVLPDGRKAAFAIRKPLWDNMDQTSRVIVLRGFNWLQDK